MYIVGQSYEQSQRVSTVVLYYIRIIASQRYVTCIFIYLSCLVNKYTGFKRVTSSSYGMVGNAAWCQNLRL